MLISSLDWMGTILMKCLNFSHAISGKHHFQSDDSLNDFVGFHLAKAA